MLIHLKSVVAVEDVQLDTECRVLYEDSQEDPPASLDILTQDGLVIVIIECTADDDLPSYAHCLVPQLHLDPLHGILQLLQELVQQAPFEGHEPGGVAVSL